MTTQTLLYLSLSCKEVLEFRQEKRWYKILHMPIKFFIVAFVQEFLVTHKIVYLGNTYLEGSMDDKYILPLDTLGALYFKSIV